MITIPATPLISCLSNSLNRLYPVEDLADWTWILLHLPDTHTHKQTLFTSPHVNLLFFFYLRSFITNKVLRHLSHRTSKQGPRCYPYYYFERNNNNTKSHIYTLISLSLRDPPPGSLDEVLFVGSIMNPCDFKLLVTGLPHIIIKYNPLKKSIFYLVIMVFIRTTWRKKKDESLRTWHSCLRYM